MDTAFSHLRTTFTGIMAQGIERLGAILPQLVIAVTAMIIGWLAASVLYHVTARALKLLAVDKIIGKTPLHGVLREFGATRPPSELIGRALFWIAILMTLLIVSELLAIEPLTRALATVVGYLPQVLAAFVILILGMLLARILQIVVTQAVGRMGLGYERAVGKTAQAIIILVVLLVASQQLGFDLTFLTTNISIIISCILLTAGIAIALGARSMVENMLLLRQLKLQIRTGDVVATGHYAGTVMEFTATGLVIDQEGKRVVLPASVLALQPFTIRGHHDSAR